MRAGDRWEFAILVPIKIATVNNGTTDCNAMASHPLCQGMNDDVGTKINRLEQPRRVESAIQHQRYAGLGGDLCDRLDIHDIKARIADNLAKDDFCVWLNGGFDRRQIIWRHKGGGNAESGQRVFQQIDVRPIHT